MTSLSCSRRAAELALAAPAAGLRGVGAVDLFLRGNQQRRERLVGLAPGRDDLVGRGLAEHVLDGLQQAAADDRVVLGQHAQRGVLLDDARQRAGNLVEPVDVRGIGQHRARQCAGLAAGGLVRLVEEGLHLRMALEHDPVEVAGDGLPVRLQRGNGGFDDGDVLRGHLWLSGSAVGMLFLLTIRASSRPPQVPAATGDLRCVVKFATGSMLYL